MLGLSCKAHPSSWHSPASSRHSRRQSSWHARTWSRISGRRWCCTRCRARPRTLPHTPCCTFDVEGTETHIEVIGDNLIFWIPWQWHNFYHCITNWPIRLSRRFCKQFSESSTVVLQLPCFLSRHGELTWNCLQNLIDNHMGQFVVSWFSQ